jgi:hypothetical protein
MFNQNAYSSNSPYGGSSEPLAFYSGASSSAGGNYYQGGGSTDNAYGGGYATGSMQGGERVSGMMAAEGRWWEAFGTGGLEGEPGLMEGE